MSPRMNKWLFGVLISIWCIAAQGAPQAALKYQRTLTREARLQWGLNAPIPVLGAQINQESRWRENVCSAFACGLAQFTPSTAKWISGVYPKDLAGGNVYNPEWAIRALVRYDHRLNGEVDRPTPDSDCDLWAFTLSAYNGGLEWVDRDRLRCLSSGRSVCNPRVWFGQVEGVNSGRSVSAFEENRGYPRTILFSQSPYATWGRTVECN